MSDDSGGDTVKLTIALRKRIELLVWYILWKTDSASRLREYSCAVCQRNKLYEKRVCYRFQHLNNRLDDPFIPVPVLDAEGKHVLDEDRKRVTTTRQLNQDEFLEVLWHIHRLIPSLSLFRLCTMFFRPICIEAFVDDVSSSILECETNASEYTIDIGNPEIRRELLGFDMSLSDLMEAFNIVRGTRNAYERYKEEEIAKQAQRK